MNQLTKIFCTAIKYGSILISLALILNTTAYAAQISDPDLSQKNAINQMHHKLHADQASAKAKEAQTLTELNEMTIRENADLTAINAKIDELMLAKKNIMRLRYAHLVEMRKILSDEQKIEYDKAVLNRSAVK
ncbi:MAG: Spy/CpxP family protein refolding chaperone [Porticoccaceae bacterium]|nr:Spy/CpxP family protein refolding chaperone [Porticoccaceae bacterium]